MKRKILAIALSLALLSSVFVFAAPVSALPTDPAEHFEVTINIYIHMPPNVTIVSDRWVGRPVEVDGVPVDGTVRINEQIAEYDVTGGTFGTGTMMGDFYTINNYGSGKGTTHAIAEFDFGGGDTFTVKMHCKKDWIGWSYPVPWSTYGGFTLISGTGAYENLRLVGDYEGAGGYGGTFTGIGHYAPKN